MYNSLSLSLSFSACVFCLGSDPTGTHMLPKQKQKQGLDLEPLNGDHNGIWAVDWRRLGQFSGAFEYSNGISWPLFVAL